MADEKEEKRVQNLIEAMRKERGYLQAPWVYMAEKEVDFMEAYNNLYEMGLKTGRHYR